jgi:hypothetical protein
MGAKRALTGVDGWVYFVRCRTTGLVKIGWTAGRAQGRYHALKVISPTPLEFAGAVRGTLGLEFHLHVQFKEHRDHGEWFRPSAELDRYIAENALSYDDANVPHEELRQVAEQLDAARTEYYARLARQS